MSPTPGRNMYKYTARLVTGRVSHRADVSALNTATTVPAVNSWSTAPSTLLGSRFQVHDIAPCGATHAEVRPAMGCL